MEEHTLPCLFSISIFLDIEAMKLLACVNKQLSIEMNAIMMDGSLWRCKVENILDIIVPDDMYKMDWQIAHDELIKHNDDPAILLYSYSLDCVNLALFIGVDPNSKHPIDPDSKCRNLDECNYAELNCLICACEYGYLEIVERLLQDERVDPMAYQNSAFILACLRGHLDIVNLLLTKGVDPSISSDTRGNPFVNACIDSVGLDLITRLLEDKRVDPRADESEALVEACLSNNLPLVDKLLTDGRIDPCYDDECALLESCFAGYVQIVERLLQDNRVDPSVIIDHDLILSLCCECKSPIIRLLLKDHRVIASIPEEELSSYYEMLNNIDECGGCDNQRI